jgi:chromosome segregation ATPase
MKPIIYRGAGLLLLIAAVMGWAGCVTGWVLLWRGVSATSTSLQKTAEELDSTLDATSELLSVLEITLDTISSKLTVIESASIGLADTLGASSEIASDFSSLSGSDFPEIVKDIQTALSSMQNSARLVDDTLGIITNLPFIGRRYTPEMPLSESVSNVSTSMDNLPKTLSSMEGNLTTASDDLLSLKEDVEILSSSLGEIKASIKVMQKALDSYQSAVSSLKERLGTFKKNLPRYMTLLSLSVALFFLWLSAAMISPFLHGLELLQRT